MRLVVISGGVADKLENDQAASNVSCGQVIFNLALATLYTGATMNFAG